LLEDYSAANVQRQIAFLREYERRTSEIPASSLDRDVAPDQQMLLNQIRSGLLSLETIRMWERNPGPAEGTNDRLQIAQGVPRISGLGLTLYFRCPAAL
jgi:hypothetical protein